MVTCLCFTCTDVYDGVSACGYSTHTAVMSSQVREGEGVRWEGVRGGGCEMGGSERGRGKREGVYSVINN